MKKQFLYLVVLASALALTSCCPRESDSSTAWENIDLPTASHFPKMYCAKETTLSITIKKTGDLLQDGTAVTESNFVRIAKSQIQKYGDFPTIVFSDKETTFKNVWPLIQKLRDVVLWRFKFAATMQRDEDQKVIGVVSFATPVEENDTDHKSGVILDMTGEEKGIILIVSIGNNELMLNGRPISHRQLDKHFAENMASLEMATIVLIPSPETSCLRLASVLDVCCKYRLLNICIMEDFNAQPTDPPYPQIAPAEAVSI